MNNEPLYKKLILVWNSFDCVSFAMVKWRTNLNTTLYNKPTRSSLSRKYLIREKTSRNIL